MDENGTKSLIVAGDPVWMQANKQHVCGLAAISPEKTLLGVAASLQCHVSDVTSSKTELQVFTLRC